ncbi:MAG: Gfo/Idh/MocA family oxidoreductase [Chloroflexi bacterium]|nr:Gfo/Idh/MocA family oxidoreductase [Chloroflexota bacterium]
MELPEPDVVINRPFALAAFRAGKHVLCEKPLACSLDEARSQAGSRSVSHYTSSGRRSCHD